MDDFKIIKCPACGSSNIENQGESIATCGHCGSKLLLKNQRSKLVSSSRDIKKLLIIITSLVAFIAAAVLWLLTINKGTQIQPEIFEMEKNPLIGKPLVLVPQFDGNAIKISNQTVATQKFEIESPQVSIVSSRKGKTSIGGLFWIFQLRNDGQNTVARPSVVVSLFNEKNQRIGEQAGWSKFSRLESQQSTEVLVLISKPPQVKFRTEILARANKIGTFDRQLESLEVKEFVINTDEKNPLKAEIIGDVYNPMAYQIDFVMVVAVAKNSQGIPVGLADAYVSTSSIAALGQSGFKVKAGTFVIEKPSSWSLYAIGSKHKQ